MINSVAIRYKDFESEWYKKWSKHLKQEGGLSENQPIHNKAWQNAIILEAIYKSKLLKKGSTALGFGVGIERVPSVLASFDIKVTATDQSFDSGKSAGWDNGQLAHDTNDLNSFGICKPDLFKRNLVYKNSDMNKIGTQFNNKFDIVWSNCALGHLGSIENGLRFIENSLKCLKPGGIAVHTTEINVTSNGKTLDSGGTVIFREKDIAKLFFKLRSKGYDCKPLVLDFGNSQQDYDLGFYPYKESTLLKINVAGHLLSQVVLVIKKPLHKKLQLPKVKMLTESTLNKRRVNKYIRNTQLNKYLDDQKIVSLNGLRSVESHFELTAQPGETVYKQVVFKNYGDTTYYDLAHTYFQNYPVIVATDKPVNRDSLFANKEWYSKNRPAVYITNTDKNCKWGGIVSGKGFYIKMSLTAPKKKGVYSENFCLALERLGVFENSEFTIKISVK